MRRRGVMRLFVLAAVLLLAAGCASIPVSTAMRFASWTERDLAQVDPAQVRVRVSVNDDYAIDVAKTRLTIALTDATGIEHQSKLPLKSLRSVRGSRPGGWFSGDVPVQTTTLSLTPDGARQLRALQQVILAGKPRAFSLDVSTGFAKTPVDPQEVTFWADLKLADQDPYIALIDGADIVFEHE